jgi:hypothetical protein
VTDKTIILHLGAHKTATTSAQNWCRNNLTELRRHGLVYVDHTHKEYSSYRIIRGTCQAAHGEFALENAAAKHAMLRSSLQRHLSLASVNHVIIPWEIFLGEPYYQGDIRLYPKLPESVDALARLFDGFIVRVIYTIRDQWSFMNSWYQQLQKMGRPLAPEVYREWAMTADLSWSPIIATLRSAFGEGDVEVLYYSSPNILQRILHAYGMPTNSNSGVENVFKNKGWPTQAMDIAAFAMPLLTVQQAARLRDLLDKGFADHPAAPFRLLDEACRADFCEKYRDDLAMFNAQQGP